LLEFGMSQINVKSGEEIKDFKLKYKKLSIGSLIFINNYPYYIGGKSGDTFYYDNAVQVVLDSQSEKYLKILSKYQSWKKENKDGQLWESITDEKNIELYNTLVEKMNSGIFTKKKPSKFSELNSEEIRNNFIKITVEEQAKVLLEVKNGLLDGTGVTYYPSGKLLQKRKFINGKAEGELVEYYENGVVKEKAYFINDKQEKEHFFYDEKGKLIKTDIYKNGIKQ